VVEELSLPQIRWHSSTTTPQHSGTKVLENPHISGTKALENLDVEVVGRRHAQDGAARVRDRGAPVRALGPPREGRKSRRAARVVVLVVARLLLSVMLEFATIKA